MPARKGRKPTDKSAVEVADQKDVESKPVEESVTPPKKGRGREKQKPTEVVVDREEELDDEPKTEGKKGRGRAKKGEEENGATKPTGKVVPKPRGRQAKAKVEETKTEEVKDDETKDSEGEAPKRRGRPQKTESSKKEDDAAPVVPKKRGRAAKEKKPTEDEGQVKLSVEH